MKLVVATRNPDKLSEIRALLDLPGTEFLSAMDFPNLSEVEEDGDTLEANAIKKAVTLSGCVRLWAIADDTGLEVEALNGAPGVYSARFSGADATYDDNNAKLLSSLKGHRNRKARFRTVVALSDPIGQSQWVQGECPGVVVEEMRGCNGFGYDPLFQPDGQSLTFSEMDTRTKNTLSHRARAFARALEAWAFLFSGQSATWPGPSKSGDGD